MMTFIFGDWAFWLRSVGSAQCARSGAHNWVLLFCAALCKGVNAHLSVALTHALYLMSKVATSTCCNETHGAVVLVSLSLSGECRCMNMTMCGCQTALDLFPFPVGYYEIWWGTTPEQLWIKSQKIKNKSPSCHSKPVWVPFFDSSVWWCHVWSTNESCEDWQWHFYSLYEL